MLKELTLADDQRVGPKFEDNSKLFMVNCKIRNSFHAENMGLHRILIYQSMKTSPML